MIGLLIFPVLVCGYIYLTASPVERLRISLYHGWSLHIRATQFGILIVAFITLLLGYVLPGIGSALGRWTGLALLPDTNLFQWLAEQMAEVLYPTRAVDVDTIASLWLVALSLASIVLTWACAWACRRFNLLGATVLEAFEQRQVVALFEDKAPVEHQLVTIKTQAKVDLAYNEAIYRARRELLENVRNGTIERHDPEDRQALKAMLEKLDYRQINYAMVTLDSGKVYFGLPSMVPEPDEESVVSSSIRLIPVRSGYRDDRQKVVITGDHPFDLASPSPEDGISLPRDRIVSVAGFKFPNRPFPGLASKQDRRHLDEPDACASPPAPRSKSPFFIAPRPGGFSPQDIRRLLAS